MALILSSTYFLQACAPLIFVGGTTAMGMAAQDQGLDGALSDQNLKILIKRLLMDHSLDLYNRIDINVYEGNVLLTGYVPTQKDENEIVKIVDSTKDVRHVFNELQLGEEQGLGDASSDAWISGKIRAELLLTSDLRSANYLVHTTDDVVYLMGVAQSQEELDEVLDIIRSTSGVKKVVNLVRMKDQELPPRRNQEKLPDEAHKAKVRATPVETRGYGAGSSPQYGAYSDDAMVTKPLPTPRAQSGPRSVASGQPAKRPSPID